MKERIIALLGNGVSPAVAASAVGCSESYVTQIASDPEVAGRISLLRFENLQAATVRDKKVDSLEDALIKKLEDSMDLLMRPAEIIKTFAIINAAKRRGAAAPEQAHIANQVIALFLPQHTAVHFQLSSSKEIIEVEGTPLITMPSSQLLIEAKNYANQQHQLPREVNNSSADQQAA